MPALKGAQFSQGLYDLYMRNFAIHQEAGCSLFMAFSCISYQGTRGGHGGTKSITDNRVRRFRNTEPSSTPISLSRERM